MPRSRVGVVLLLPEPAGSEVDVLRRAVGADDVDRLASHLTLVPPVNVRDDDMDSALDLLRDAAERTAPFRLVLGPPRTFLPINPVLYLEVGGDVAAGRQAARPHLPPAAGAEPDLAVPAPRDPARQGDRRAHPCRPGGAGRRTGWRSCSSGCTCSRSSTASPTAPGRGGPIAEATFGGPAVVGRGGLELALEVGERLSVDARTFLDRAWAQHDEARFGRGRQRLPLAVTARRADRIVGVATGDDHGRDRRGAPRRAARGPPTSGARGWARHLLAAFASAAAERDATYLTLRTEAGGPAEGFFGRLRVRPWLRTRRRGASAATSSRCGESCEHVEAWPRHRGLQRDRRGVRPPARRRRHRRGRRGPPGDPPRPPQDAPRGPLRRARRGPRRRPHAPRRASPRSSSGSPPATSTCW